MTGTPATRYEARVDQWIWAIRLYRTRSAATLACRAGHVSVNGAGAKAATPVRVGDRVEVRGLARPHDLEVLRVIDKRVGAAVAATCALEHAKAPEAGEAPLRTRDPGTGRPTKRDRRQLDRLRG